MRSTVLGTPRIGAHHRDRREAARARYRQFDVPELGQQMTRVGTVAAIGLVARGHPIEMLIDRPRHLTLQDARRSHPGRVNVPIQK